MATRHTISRICERIDELTTRLGVDRSRPIYVFGSTRGEAERNAAEYRERYPQDADRPMRYVVMWAGEMASASSQPIHVRETETGTWVARDRDRGKTP